RHALHDERRKLAYISPSSFVVRQDCIPFHRSSLRQAQGRLFSTHRLSYSLGRSRSLSRTVLRVPNLIVFCPSLESWPLCSRLLISCCIVWARSSSPWLSSRVTALLSFWVAPATSPDCRSWSARVWSLKALTFSTIFITGAFTCPICPWSAVKVSSTS